MRFIEANESAKSDLFSYSESTTVKQSLRFLVDHAHQIQGLTHLKFHSASMKHVGYWFDREYFLSFIVNKNDLRFYFRKPLFKLLPQLWENVQNEFPTIRVSNNELTKSLNSLQGAEQVHSFVVKNVGQNG